MNLYLWVISYIKNKIEKSVCLKANPLMNIIFIFPILYPFGPIMLTINSLYACLGASLFTVPPDLNVLDSQDSAQTSFPQK